MRQSISKLHSIIVFRRDYWTCRYCNEAVFFTPALKVFDSINPGHGYYHPNGKTGAVLDIFQWRWATVDHVLPVSKGGLNHLDNYVTACWRCNLTLNDKLEGKDKTRLLHETNRNMDWDGFSGLYLKLGPRDAWSKILALTQEQLIELDGSQPTGADARSTP